jgi:hypothetical protein
MAFQINGTDVIDNTGQVNLATPLDPDVWESMFSAQSDWNTDDFTTKSGSSSQTMDLKNLDVWPNTEDFREAWFEVKLNSIPSSGSYSFTSNVYYQHGSQGSNYSGRAILCPSQANFVPLADRPYQGMLLHLINRRENFTTPTYQAVAYYTEDDTTGIGNLRSSSGASSKLCDWESTFGGSTDRLYILFPTFGTSSVSWRITCRWR